MVAIQMDQTEYKLGSWNHGAAKAGSPRISSHASRPIADRMPPGKSGVRVEARATADLDGACARRLEKSISRAEECPRRGRTKEWEKDGQQKKMT
jgi:hypothetical protein